jgi:hypothetical protein
MQLLFWLDVYQHFSDPGKLGTNGIFNECAI